MGVVIWGQSSAVSGNFCWFKAKWVLLDLFPDFFLMVPTFKKSLQKRCQELENVCVFKFLEKSGGCCFVSLCVLCSEFCDFIYIIFMNLFFLFQEQTMAGFPSFVSSWGITLKSTPFRKIVPETIRLKWKQLFAVSVPREEVTRRRLSQLSKVVLIQQAAPVSSQALHVYPRMHHDWPL